MPTLFSLTVTISHVLMGLGVNYLFNLFNKNAGWAGLVVYLIIVLHSKYLLLEKLSKIVSLVYTDKNFSNKKNEETEE